VIAVGGDGTLHEVLACVGMILVQNLLAFPAIDIGNMCRW
jgi:hypothetical protein